MSGATTAVIGGGIAGLTAARRLAAAGRQVVVFDKGRGVAGRASTRFAEDGLQFDHGAQYFTIRSEPFAAEVDRWVDLGVAALWDGRIGAVNCDLDGCRIAETPTPIARYVGIPGMNEPARFLAREVTTAGGRIVTAESVAQIDRAGSRWRVVSGSGQRLGEFDRVLITCPAPQAAELLGVAPALSNAAKTATMNGCWAAMVCFNQRVTPLPDSGEKWDALFINGPIEATPLSWVARDSSKPGRPLGAGDCWVLHGSSDWSEANIEAAAKPAAAVLLEGFWRATGAEPQQPVHCVAHRWRFAVPASPLEDRRLADEQLGLFAAGDWCGGPRFEGAFLSGLAAAKAMMNG